MEDEIIKLFGNQLRIRVSGILIETGRILMILHKSLGPVGKLWAPPGGGMQYGSSAADNLIREFHEETGLRVEVTRFLFINEYLEKPLHAIELFFEVRKIAGVLKAGIDPEMGDGNQIIKSISFMGREEIEKINKNQLHHIFRNSFDPEKIARMGGYYFMGEKVKLK